MTGINITNETLRQIQDAKKQFKQLFDSIPKYKIDEAFLAQNIVSRIPSDYFKQVAEAQRQIQAMLKQIDLSHLYDAIHEIQKPFVKIAEEAAKTHKFMQYTADTIKEANTILLDLGWWIYPDRTIPTLRNIINAHKDGKDNEIEQAIIDYFNDKRFDEMLASWKSNKKLALRVQIFEDAVWAHKQGKFTLSIPALLPHVEGLINENSGKTGRIRHDECISIFESYLNQKFKKGTVSSLYPLAVLKFVENLLKGRFEWGKPSKKDRHSILHGHYVSYSDKVFSLKLILLIDFIQNLI